MASNQEMLNQARFNPPFLNIDNVPWLKNDQLEVELNVWGQAGAVVQLRGISRHGGVRTGIVSETDRSQSTVRARLQDFPLFLTVFTSTAGVAEGSTYVNVFLRVGGASLGCLMAGYVTDMKPLIWPPGIIRSSVQGQGNIRVVAGTNPAAGAEISETVPTNAQWRLISLLATLVTDATAANRSPKLTLTLGSECLRTSHIGNVTASLTQIINWGAFGMASFTAGNASYSGLPADLRLPQGTVIATVTGSLQAGDDYGAPVLLVEEWLTE